MALSPTTQGHHKEQKKCGKGGNQILVYSYNLYNYKSIRWYTCKFCMGFGASLLQYPFNISEYHNILWTRILMINVWYLSTNSI